MDLVRPKDQINFTMMADGTVIMRAKKRSITELQGLLTPPDGVTVSIEDMNAWRK